MGVIPCSFNHLERGNTRGDGFPQVGAIRTPWPEIPGYPTRMKKNGKAQLRGIATGQDGQFATAQARACGLSRDQLLLMRRNGTRRLAMTARWLVGIALAITLFTAVAYHSGRIGECSVTPDAYWTVRGRCVSKMDALYLSTITRSTGVLLGAAFAMVWRPRAAAHTTRVTAARICSGDASKICWVASRRSPSR